jgi:hypothetical protein
LTVGGKDREKRKKRKKRKKPGWLLKTSTMIKTFYNQPVRAFATSIRNPQGEEGRLLHTRPPNCIVKMARTIRHITELSMGTRLVRVNTTLARVKQKNIRAPTTKKTFQLVLAERTREKHASTEGAFHFRTAGLA